MSKKIICRFTNKDNMEKFIDKIGMEGLSPLTKEIDFENNTHKERKIVNRKPATEKEWERQWTNLPEFRTDFSTDEYAKIILLFSDKTTVEELSALFEQK